MKKDERRSYLLIVQQMNSVVSILGCGWYGQALASSLVARGYLVKGSTTSRQKLDLLQSKGIEPFLIDLQEGKASSEDEAFFDCDVLVVASNVNLGKRLNYLSEIRKLIAHIRTHAVKKVIFISSVSVYGEPNMTVDERTLPAPGTDSGKLLLQAEDLLLAESHLDVTVVRFGGLVGPGRMPGRFLAGRKNIPNGLAPVNLIHLNDCIGLTEAILAPGTSIRLINGVSPDHPRRQDFYRRAAEIEGLAVPEFIPNQGEWKEVTSVYGDDLYRYRMNDWSKWLNDLVAQ